MERRRFFLRPKRGPLGSPLSPYIHLPHALDVQAASAPWSRPRLGSVESFSERNETIWTYVTQCALEPVPVFMPEVGHLSVEALEEALHTAARAGHPASSLLLTNPNNPLGTLYTESELLDTMAWALKRGLHVISDEIYALSVFGCVPEWPFGTLHTVRV